MSEFSWLQFSNFWHIFERLLLVKRLHFGGRNDVQIWSKSSNKKKHRDSDTVVCSFLIDFIRSGPCKSDKGNLFSIFCAEQEPDQNFTLLKYIKQHTLCPNKNAQSLKKRPKSAKLLQICIPNGLKSNFGARLSPRAKKAPQKEPQSHDLDLLLGGQIEQKSIKQRSYFWTRFLVDLFIASGTVLGAFCLHFRYLFRTCFQTSDVLDFWRVSHTICILLQARDPQKSIKNQ